MRPRNRLHYALTTLTADIALQLSEEHWRWLARTGCKHKHLWPKFKEFGTVWAHCFLCHYSWATRSKSCRECPLFRKWSDTESLELDMCTDSRTPYVDWERATKINDRRHHAKRVADLIKAERRRRLVS